MASIKTFGVPFVKVIGTSLRQWESGRKLQVNPVGNREITRLDIAHKGSTNALVVIPKEKDGIIVADIPNILLQSDQDIVVFCVNVYGEKVEVIDECVFTVKKRPKPDDYVYTETEVLNYTTLEKRISDMEKNGAPGGTGGTVVLDTTLTKSGEAADAMAVGDALAEKVDVKQGKDNAGKLLYVGKDGLVAPLTLGNGLQIVNGVLTITGQPSTPEEAAIAFIDNGDGSATVQGVTFEDQGNGVVLMRGYKNSEVTA